MQIKQLDSPDLENGEVEPKEAYDPKIFISYPGFNTPLPEGVNYVSASLTLFAPIILVLPCIFAGFSKGYSSR